MFLVQLSLECSPAKDSSHSQEWEDHGVAGTNTSLPEDPGFSVTLTLHFKAQHFILLQLQLLDYLVFSVAHELRPIHSRSILKHSKLDNNYSGDYTKLNANAPHHIIDLQDAAHGFCRQSQGAQGHEQWLHNQLLQDVGNATLREQAALTVYKSLQWDLVSLLLVEAPQRQPTWNQTCIKGLNYSTPVEDGRCIHRGYIMVCIFSPQAFDSQT